MKRTIGLVCALLVVLPMVDVVEAASQYSIWKHSGSMFIITTPDGANLPAGSEVKDFPLLVRLDKDFFDFGQAQPNGEDIRFSSPDGTGLAYEIEQWDREAGVASIWVRIPLIKGNDRQEIRIHWGNPDAASASDGTAVFNASNGYVGVWHLGGDVRDATGNLKSQDNGTTETKGIIGRARHFPGGKGVFCGQDIQVMPSGGSPHSTEAWFRPEVTNGQIVDWGKEKAQGKVQMWYRSPASVRVDCYFSNGNVSAKLPDRAKGWNHAVHTYENDQAILYINGKKKAVGNPKRARMNIERPARLWIGGWYNRYDFIGDIDEVRISSVARSADWVRLEYENQKPMQTLVGPVVRHGRDLSLSASRQEVNEGGTIDFTASAGGAQKIYWILERDGAEKIVAVDRCSYGFDAGRVSGDQSATIRLKAVYPSEVKTKAMPIKVRESIPDPVVTLEAPLTWDGRHRIEVKARIDNLAEMQARGAGKLEYTWIVSNIATIKKVAPGKLILHRAQNSGLLQIEAKVSNGGEVVTASTTIRVQEPPSDPWVYRTPDANEMPMDNQFYARDGSGKGVLYCNGKMDRRADALLLKLYADGKLIDTQTQKPAMGDAYSFAAKLTPGLIKYRVELVARSGAEQTILHTATNIVCGDAYLIDGQSNALATDTREQSPPQTSQWIRSYGNPQWFPEDQRENLWCNPVWKIGRGKERRASMNKYKTEIGWWGMELAKRLVHSQKIPIFIVNGAVGGTRIDQHQRNETDPTDLKTIYGRMLWRVRQAKLTHGIRAIIWHQGENDQGSAGPDGGYGWETYQRYFIDMSAAWKRDFPNVSRYYIFQIWPNSCSMGGEGRGDMLREKQRTLPQLYSNMEILSTLGIRPPGSCHYPLKGWTMFAKMLQPMIERDFYGRKADGPLSAPNLKRAYYTSDVRNAIALEFDQPVVWKASLVSEFRLDGEKNKVASGHIFGNVLTLKLIESSQAKTISYIDEMNWSQDRLLIGKNGIAALTFCKVPIAGSMPDSNGAGK